MAENQDSREEQKVEVISASSGRERTLLLGELVPLDIRSGEARHYFVPVSVLSDGKEREAGTFVLRRYSDRYFNEWSDDESDWNEDLLQMYLKHYAYLKDQGFPVPTTVSRVKGKNGILISDLRMGGKTVFSWNEILTGKFDPVGKISNLDEVKIQLTDIAKKGDEKGMLISKAAYYILLNPTDNKAEVMLGDLGADVYLPGEYKSDEGERPRSCVREAEQLFQSLREGMESN